MTSASLRIITNELDINFVSDAFGVEPTLFHIKGERMSPQNPRSSLFENSIWILESSRSKEAMLADHVEELVRLIEQNEKRFKLMRPKIISSDIFCMFSPEVNQGTAQFSPSLLRRMANQSLELIVDLYEK